MLANSGDREEQRSVEQRGGGGICILGDRDLLPGVHRCSVARGFSSGDGNLCSTVIY